jgi:hypothetical protein
MRTEIGAIDDATASGDLIAAGHANRRFHFLTFQHDRRTPNQCHDRTNKRKRGVQNGFRIPTSVNGMLTPCHRGLYRSKPGQSFRSPFNELGAIVAQPGREQAHALSP